MRMYRDIEDNGIVLGLKLLVALSTVDELGVAVGGTTVAWKWMVTVTVTVSPS